MRRFRFTVTLVAVMLLAAGSARAQVGPVYSLDDSPAAPITSPPGAIPGFGAEDPYGIGLVTAPGLAPSPSLPAVAPMMATDQDLLVPSPVPIPVPTMHLLTPGPGWLDAVSDNAFKINPAPMIHLGFSVDRLSLGISGAVAVEAACNQQSGDIYHTDQSFTHPAAFVGLPPSAPGYSGLLPTVGMGNSNLMLFDESVLGLTVVGIPGIPVPPGVSVPPPLPASLDNLDALIWKLFDMLIDVGFDAIHPIDPTAGMDLGEAKAKYGDKVCLMGNVDCTYIMTWGTPDEVREDVKRCIRQAAKGGGYICTTSNSVHSATKPENYIAMVEAIKEYGKYPISL